MVAEGWQTVSHTSLRCAKGYDTETTPSLVFAELGSRQGSITYAICSCVLCNPASTNSASTGKRCISNEGGRVDKREVWRRGIEENEFQCRDPEDSLAVLHRPVFAA